MKTAVEQLEKQILDNWMDILTGKVYIGDLFEQAKEMEKEIAEKEFFKGLNFGINIPNDMTPSQYYNETFKQQEQ
jgi:hypothetical protein